MNAKELFDKYYARLNRESIFKALFCGFTVGFLVNFAVAFATWFMDVNGLWWSIGALVVATAIATPLFYFKKFKPDEKEIARRLDRLGLDERMITMTEFLNDDSFIAQKQREDARVSLHKIDTKFVQFVFSRVMIILLSVSFVFGAGMTVVTGLSDAGIIDSGREVLEEIFPEEPVVYVTVTYVVAEGEGMFEGDDVQIIELGSDTMEIIAVADDGYAFVEWSDGITDPNRTEYGVETDLVIEAVFASIGDGEGEGEGEGEGGGEGQGGQGDEPGKSDQPSKEEGEPNPGANGAYEENNMVKDGQTYYRDILESGGYYEEAIKWLESAEGIPDELRKFIQTYFDIIV